MAGLSPAQALSPGPRPAVTITRRQSVGLVPRPCLSPFAAADGASCELEFLNVRRGFSLGAMEWHPEDVSRLWRYNLHYFDYLLDDAVAVRCRDLLIDDWIAANPAGTAAAWEAYPTSLRIVNWIDYFLRTGNLRPLKASWLESLYAQTSWLERNVEQSPPRQPPAQEHRRPRLRRSVLQRRRCRSLARQG